MVIDIVCPAVGNPVSTHVGEVIVDVYPMHYNWKNQITTICEIGVVGGDESFHCGCACWCTCSLSLV